MKCSNFVAVTLSCVFVWLAVPQAKADFAITDFGRVQVNNFSGTNRTLAWIFTANTPMEVTHLGVWDNDTDGLLASHRVGIWDAGGTLLGDTTILSGTGSPTAGGVIGGGTWRYEPINISLAAGRYTIGALYNSDDDFESDASFVTASPFIAFDEERFSNIGSGFVFPTNTAGRNGLFGPNFQFNIPEPDCSGFPCGNNDNKVQLCHVPPGNPANEQTLCISPNAVPAHLENHEGDHCGPCDGVPGDLDGDGAVGIADLVMLLGEWGSCPAQPDACPGDVDLDDIVGITDLLILLGNWG